MPVETRVEAVAGPVPEAASRAQADVIAVPVSPGTDGASVAEEHGTWLGLLLPLGADDLLAFHRVKGEPGEIVAAPVRLDDRVAEVLLYGVGASAESDLRKAGATLVRRWRGRPRAVVAPPSEGELGAFVEGVLLGGYDFRIGAPAPEHKRPVGTLAIVTADTAAIERGAAFAGVAALARDLANTPSKEKDPAWLAERAVELAADSGLIVRIRDEHELRTEGFGGLIAVGAGSVRPPRLIELTYDPTDSHSDSDSGSDTAARATANGAAAVPAHYVLVGKGITFDSGGLSLKPNDNMKAMKTDMAGGGAVLAVMSALRKLGVRVRVTALVAAAENMPSATAMRPSDVITHFGGTTSEVLNTDAEGRLVLADALAYADLTLSPDVIVDIATLTGAAKVALGMRHGALFATDDGLADELTEAGAASGEPLWRMPLVEEYREAIDSKVADLSNIGQGGFGGGAITAGLFLREFAGQRRWAHLDIAGPARAMSDDAEISRGATGFGARLLLRWLASA